MKFAQPLALYLGVAVPYLIILYTIKSQPKRVHTSTSIIWKRVLKKEAPKTTIWQRLISTPFFWIHLLLILFFLMTLSRPYFPSNLEKRVLYLLDTSLSMRFKDIPGSRFEKAKAALIQHLRFSENSRITLFTFDRKIHKGPFDVSDPDQIKQFLQKTTAGLNPNGDNGYLEQALQDQGGGAFDEIFIFSDNYQFSESLTLQAIRGVEYFNFGDRAPNLSLLHLDGFIDGDFFKGRAVVGNSHLKPQKFVVRVFDGDSGKLLHSDPGWVLEKNRWVSPLWDIPLGSGKKKPSHLKFEVVPSRGDSGNQLAEDDCAYWNFNLPSVRVQKSGEIPTNLQKLLSFLPIKWGPELDLPVIGSFSPGKIPKKGGVFFLKKGSSTQQGEGAVVVTGANHPAMEFTLWKNITVKSRTDWVPEGYLPLISDEKGPLIIASPPQSAPQILILFDIEEGSFSDSLTFPIFFTNCLEWVTGKSLNASGFLPQNLKESDSSKSEKSDSQFYYSCGNPEESFAHKSQEYRLPGKFPPLQNSFGDPGGIDLAHSSHTLWVQWGIGILFFLYVLDSFGYGFSKRIGV